ncbi:hypothetical protein NC651_037795 [Populus alba x Populus x berolinensis]|nr:hypothetical protein NC651_037795 [Populus alba x Populus x berolinensis]
MKLSKGHRGMVENLRWVGMSNNDLDKKYDPSPSLHLGTEFYGRETKIVPIGKYFKFQNSREEHEVQGENGHADDCMGFNDSEDFSLGFINDEPNDDTFIDESNVDDLTSSRALALWRIIKVIHGLFVFNSPST